MANSLSGEVQFLKANQKKRLQQLTDKRSQSDEVIDSGLAKRAGELVAELGVHLGLLLNRDGSVAYVVVGNKRNLYLPDLGRYRLDKARLRRLRLIVFVPPGAEELEDFPAGPYRDGEVAFEPYVESPVIATDFLTDLEKLRFDALAVIAVNGYGDPASVSFAHLVPQRTKGYLDRDSPRPISFEHAKNLRSLKINFSELAAELEDMFSVSQAAGHDTDSERAVLLCVHTGVVEDAEVSMAELSELARTAGVVVADEVFQRRKKIDPRTLMGKGKIEEIVLHCLDLGADILIFDRELSPSQLRSISKLTELKVLNRSMLILDIFAQRAKSSEGRVQVELAQLRYSLPRLTEVDTGMSRLTGGIGGRGPGETKLEIGRRRARDRIRFLEKKLEKHAKQRELRRSRRINRGVPVIAVVGYTNAGKSTLLNAITKSDVFVENKLFATLDTSSRRMRFPNEKEVVFVDTVGFIRELPDELVQAFRATLEEVADADALLHLVDVSTEGLKERIEVVERTLDELEITEAPRVLALNKIDAISKLEISAISNSVGGFPVSALSREGIAELLAELQRVIANSFAGQDPGRFAEIVPWEK